MGKLSDDEIRKVFGNGRSEPEGKGFSKTQKVSFKDGLRTLVEDARMQAEKRNRVATTAKSQRQGSSFRACVKCNGRVVSAVHGASLTAGAGSVVGGAAGVAVGLFSVGVLGVLTGGLGFLALPAVALTAAGGAASGNAAGRGGKDLATGECLDCGVKYNYANLKLLPMRAVPME